MPTSAEAFVDRLLPIVRSRLPPGVTPAYFDAFIQRNRAVLIAILDRQLAARTDRTRPSTPPPDLWSASQRTAANLAAMQIAASKRPDEMSTDDRSAPARGAALR